MIYSLLDQYTLLSSSNVIFEGFTEFSCLAIIVSSSYYSDFWFIFSRFKWRYA